ncbi:MAG: FAD-dependent oxidoreductase [Candidatus Verstraetearchaeota archaeon]|nr:FAD-dependent oxidoreductase [Candidatus Verstraetearchaeota archaeon]
MGSIVQLGILGAGLSGLVIAYKSSFPALIFEASNTMGGLLRSEEIEGYVFDAGGSHIVFSKDQQLLATMLSFLDGKWVEHRRDARIYYRGRFIKYPFENGLYQLPPQERYECLASFVKHLVRRARGELKPPRNFKEWCYYVFGEAIANRHLVPYSEKIWKHPLKEISLDWVSGRVPEPPVEDVLKSAVGLPTEGYTHQLTFYYPLEGGIHSLARSLASKAQSKCVFLQDHPVKRIKPEDRCFIVSSGRKEYSVEKLVSTIPLPELLKALPDSAVPEKVKEAVKKLKYLSLAVVGLGVRGRAPPYHWVYLPFNGIAHRISFPSNYSPHNAPIGHYSVLAEISYLPSDDLSKMSDSSLVERVVDDLHEMGVIKREHVVLSKVWRWNYAYIVYDHSYRSAVSTIKNYLNTLGITVAGRFGGWQYLNMDAVVDEALKVAEDINLSKN